jgi:hypothetical protein
MCYSISYDEEILEPRSDRKEVEHIEEIFCTGRLKAEPVFYCPWVSPIF